MPPSRAARIRARAVKLNSQDERKYRHFVNRPHQRLQRNYAAIHSIGLDLEKASKAKSAAALKLALHRAEAACLDDQLQVYQMRKMRTGGFGPSAQTMANMNLSKQTSNAIHTKTLRMALSHCMRSWELQQTYYDEALAATRETGAKEWFPSLEFNVAIFRHLLESQCWMGVQRLACVNREFRKARKLSIEMQKIVILPPVEIGHIDGPMFPKRFKSERAPRVTHLYSVYRLEFDLMNEPSCIVVSDAQGTVIPVTVRTLYQPYVKTSLYHSKNERAFCMYDGRISCNFDYIASYSLEYEMDLPWKSMCMGPGSRVPLVMEDISLFEDHTTLSVSFDDLQMESHIPLYGILSRGNGVLELDVIPRLAISLFNLDCSCVCERGAISLHLTKAKIRYFVS
jgi:hypothetical protein